VKEHGAEQNAKEYDTNKVPHPVVDLIKNKNNMNK
jgi:hypothetical protein